MLKLINIFSLLLLLISCSTQTSYLDDSSYIEANVTQLTMFRTGLYTGKATGFYLRYKDKTVLVTNKHVCSGSNIILSKDETLTNFKMSTKVDLCLIKTNIKNGFELGTVEGTIHETIKSAGHSLGDPIISFKRGTVEELFTDIHFDIITYKLNVLSMRAFPGDSGSPIINSKGKVIGVLNAVAGNGEPTTFFVPLADLKEFLSQA